MSKNKSAVLLGLCYGDAKGMQFETKPWNDPAVLAWDGQSYGSNDYHKLGPGQYTDDGCMAIALSESLLKDGDRIEGFFPERTAKYYLDWYLGSNFRGAGKNTKKALQTLRIGEPWYNSGIPDALGNGTAMRVAPLGVFFRNEPTKLIKAAKLDAMITHDSHEAFQGSIAVAMGISLLLNGVEKENLLESVKRVLDPSRVLDNLNLITANPTISKTLKNKNYNCELDRNGGVRIISQLILGNLYTVVETVARAFYVFLATNSFAEAMECVIRASGDSDTAAAICGALCGAYYGSAGIDRNFIEHLENSQYIMELDEKLYEER